MTEPIKTINDKDIQNVEPALIRAAERALELGLKNKTPVYVWKEGKIVDLTLQQKA
ncbi:MAG: hypothetical protein P9L94_10285 [Candidatus Hinthialibacter antarcticus]|nr:hypothetical protein [Candidatus Hinthialibacter antarcticus]